MADLINRQAAIAAIRASTSKYTGFMEMEMYTDDDAVEAIEGLPSAQPEIIYCKDCVHNIITRPNAGNALCEIYDGMYDLYGYCHEGERRQDG